MPKPIRWSPLSEKDFERVLEYLAQEWNSQVALHFVDLTDQLLQQIALNPKLFPVIHSRKKIRKCVLTKHNALYYTDRKTRIDILRIYDTRQNPKNQNF